MIKYLLTIFAMNVFVIVGIWKSFEYSALWGFALVLVIPFYVWIIGKI